MTKSDPASAKRYRLLLRLLPAEFRGDYGAEMEQVFADQRADAERHGDKMGVARLWWETAKGIFTTAPREHFAMLKQDSAFALRMMRKNLGFTIAAIVVLGLGIGANTAIFSVVNGVLLKPLPYEHGERLLMLRERLSRNGPAGRNASVSELNDYRVQTQSLDAVVEYHNMQFILLGRAEPEEVQTGVVSWNFFDVFGAKPLLGRNFAPEDEKRDAPAVLLLSYEYWLRSFGGDPTVLGKVFRMNDKPHTVIGILPPFPQYPQENNVYMPATACPFRNGPHMLVNRQMRMLQMFGRMKPGVKPGEAEADLSTVAAVMQKEYPNDYPDAPPSIEATPLKTELTYEARPMMLLLLAAAGFVLLIACANVANLNLARMVRRERELGVRTAMGASRVRLFRQLLTESALLALVGGAIGLLLADGGLRLLTTYVARFTPRASEVHIDATVLLFTLGIALFVSVLTGTAPAVARREGLITTLKEGSTQSTLGSSRGKLRSALLVAQVSVSFLLLIGAGLMVRSLINLKRVDPGFRPENVLTVQLNLDFARYTANEKVLSFVESLLDKVQAVPGVTSVAAAGTFPLDKSPSSNNEFVIEGEHRTGSDKRIAEVNIISPGYLDVLGIPLLSGRNFDRRDRPDSPHVALITQALAQHYWNNADPIGRRLSFDDGKTWTQIIGVIGDVHEHGLDQPAAEFIHLPFAQYPTNGPALMARTQSDPMAIARTAVQRLYEVDPNQPAGRIQSLEQYRADSIAAPRLTANLLGLFALLALAIAAAGIGGVMGLAVSQRTHEIGVRMAIGARPAEIVRMILNQGMGLVLVGVAVGLAGAFALTNAVKSFLFQVTPNDPATFVGVAAVLAVSALAACYIPARRAARVDPLLALRTE
ncbi:MAG TPA: ABC transporter permease [Candidatus Eisenbacteria bacterium]|nr:ABC transporter permease [Candidatus Eisenbacteria bacterium]